MRFFKLHVAALGLAVGFAANAANSANVTPDIIFGSGNSNGSFTITNFSAAGYNIELGLRGKLRYDDLGAPQSIYNWDGVDTYAIGERTSGTPANRSVFNYEWSVNVADTPFSIAQLISRGFRAEIGYDLDPTAGVNFSYYDPFAADAYYGTNSTPNGGGTYDNTGTPVAGTTVAQNSVNYGFIPGAPLSNGIYDISFNVYNPNNQQIGSTRITISAVPVPAAGLLLLTAFGGLSLAMRRRRKLA